MTYPSVGDKGPTVAAGGRDESNSLGPSLQGQGIDVPQAVFYDGSGYTTHRDATADTSNPPPTVDRDGDDGLPDIPRYEGPDVPDSANALPAPMVNPSAGTQGPVEQGMDDINPEGRVFAPGDIPPNSDRTVYPDTTKDIYPR